MSIKKLISSVRTEINNIKKTPLDFTHTSNVPCIDDRELTFEQGKTKGGECIETCVLYVDIRDSVKLNEEKQTRTMAKIYSAFAKCVLMAAREEGGYVRNIVGDRVMVVFPKESCYTKAVRCAITINHISTLINRQFNNLEFRCGIGIDYGRMNVIKVGLPRQGDEKDENRALVWVGYPANYASRLTDVANKKFKDTYYDVTADFYYFNLLDDRKYLSLISWKPKRWYRETKRFTDIEFAKQLCTINNTLIFHDFRNLINLEKKEESYQYPAILISDTVYKGFQKENSIKGINWKKQTRKIKDIDFDVWGCSNIWKLR